jgi:uncharacterized delta-60 repeat protein
MTKPVQGIIVLSRNHLAMFAKTAFRRLALALLVMSTAVSVFGGAGSVDTTFNVIANNTVYSVLTQPDGKILIGGAFSTVAGVPRYGLARLFPDGTLDTSLSNSISAQGTVYAMLMQPDGKLLVAGSFNVLSRTFPYGEILNVARLNVDGSIDGTFTNSTPTGTVFALGLQTDGKVLIGGQFTSVGAAPHYYIARLNSNGTVDSTFNAGVISGSAVNAIAVQSDGNILIGGAFGSFTTYGLTRNNLARLLTNGIPDLSYQPSATAPVQSVFLQGDGKSVWGGSFINLDGAMYDHIGRLNSNGTADPGFNGLEGPNSTVYAVTEDADGDIYVGGIMSTYYSSVHEGVARVFSDGTLDNSFNSTTNFSIPQIRCLAIQGDGKVLAGGNFTSFNSFPRTNLVRLYGDNYPAEIITQPRSQNVAVGTNVTFSVDVSNPTAVNYQWLKDGVDIPGATDSQYSLFNVQLADAGTYSVFASTELGGTTSSNALLQVGIAPQITLQPTNLTVAQGQDATFTAAASGTPLNYFWMFGTNVVGTNDSLTLTDVAPGQAGNYVMVASNFLGSVTSAPAFLSVLFPITLVTNPADEAVLVGGTAVFGVGVTGNPLNFQWFKDGNPIGGANASNYSIMNVALTNAGGYSVVVSNQFNSVTSTVANLSVGILPQTVQFHLNADRSLTLQMPGTPGFNYVLQTATNLTPPVVWQNVASNQTATNGDWTYVDTNPPVAGSRYYRVTTP